MDLYDNISPQELGLPSQTEEYLNNIFDKTVIALKTDINLFAYFAYIQNNLAGFSTFGLLEDHNNVLLRTLPISLDYKNLEIHIRSKFINHVKEKFANTKQVIMMIRKANKVHKNLAIENGFEVDNRVFEISNYIKKTYNSDLYNGYSLFYCKIL